MTKNSTAVTPSIFLSVCLHNFGASIKSAADGGHAVGSYIYKYLYINQAHGAAVTP